MSHILLQFIEELNAGRLRVIDLTQPLSSDTPLLVLPAPWTNTPGFKMWELSRYDDRGPAWYWNAFETGEHTGTHLDAPIHWISGKDLPDNSVDRLPPSTFVGPACVIDVSEACAQDADFLLTPSDIERWEEAHGKIPRGAWVLLRAGWAERCGTPGYFNVREDGPHTPGWSTECSKFLAVDRDVLGVGVEMIGTDAGQAARFSPPFSNHYFMHGSGKLGLAHLCNLDQLPPTGAVVFAAPLKIVNGSGSPVRAFAIVPASS
jgi:kynurenine formamidase